MLQQCHSIMLKDLTPRLYQERIFGAALQKNTLVVLPTGLGKTAIAILLAAYHLKKDPLSKIVMLAPTKPLADQHRVAFLKHLSIDESRAAVFTGDISPEKRMQAWPDLQLIFSTPQGLENDLLSQKLDVKNVSLVIFDEAHRAVGDYSYVFLAKTYIQRAANPHILALTASPGSEIEKIEEVINNLQIETVEIRTEKDPDVAPYVQKVDADWITIDLPPEFTEARSRLEACKKSKINELKNYGFTPNGTVTKKTILETQKQILASMNSNNQDPGNYKALSILAEIMKADHALEILESQGVGMSALYIRDLQTAALQGKTKAVQNLVQDANFRLAAHKIQEMNDKGIEHPKFARLRELLRDSVKNPASKVIVFTQYRETAKKIQESLLLVPEVKSEVFVGQQKRAGVGLSQKKQIAMLDDFRAGKFNTLIATSVAEEGLDIPQVDQVIFYEPIPSAIRHIQRRGRTGRHARGGVKILVAKGTRDEAYRWTAHAKEKMMKDYFGDLRKTVADRMAKRQVDAPPVLPVRSTQPTLSQFTNEPEAVKVIADYREKASGVLKELSLQGVNLSLEMLGTADYLLSSRVGVEFKTSEDFVGSILDGRLFDQLKSLKNTFDRPIILVEGERDLTTIRQIHPNAIYGMLATISVSFGIPILWSKNPQESAQLLIAIAKREQLEKDNLPQKHFEKSMASLQETQEYIVSSFPNVGPSLARQLLNHFGTIKKFMNASLDDLKEVPNVGEKKAKQIFDVINGAYQKRS